MLLSETELRAALEPLLDRLLAERLRLFQLQFEPRVQAQIAAALQPQSALELQDGLRRIGSARTPAQVFAALFEAGAAMIGQQRALIAVHGEQAAVWKQEGLSLPARFPAAQREQVLAHETSAPIKVRGTTVGYFCWKGAGLPAPVEARLAVLIQFAGLVLLESGLPTAKAAAARLPVASTQALPERQEANSEAGRFAELLIEDLRLFLTRERDQDLSMGVRAGDWRSRFAPEIERCRQAFAVRYSSAEEAKLFEEVVPRLAARLEF